MAGLGFSAGAFSFLCLPPHKKGAHLKAAGQIRGGAGESLAGLSVMSPKKASCLLLSSFSPSV